MYNIAVDVEAERGLPPMRSDTWAMGHMIVFLLTRGRQGAVQAKHSNQGVHIISS